MSYEQWAETLRSSFTRLIESFAQHLPGVIGALALIVVGWIVARLLRALIVRLARVFDWLLKNDTVRDALSRVGVKQSAGEIVGNIVFWAVVLLFLAAATEILGLPVIATWFGGLTYYLPRVLVGILIVLAGLLAGRFAGDAIRRAADAANLAHAAALGRATQGVVLLIAVVTACEQLGIDTALLTATITIVIGAMIGGAALSFALGSRVQAGNIIAAHYVRQAYEIGQTVKVAGVQGRIVEFATNAVIIETPEGRLLVPAEEFSRGVSLLVTGA
jgi:hypothetical protein